MIIDACKPFAWRDRFPSTSVLSRVDARDRSEMGRGAQCKEDNILAGLEQVAA
jgi:hypothetical protein